MAAPLASPGDRRTAMAIGSIVVWLLCVVGLLDLGFTALSSWMAWHRGYQTHAMVAAKRAQETPWFQGFLTLEYTSDRGIPTSGEYPVERFFYEEVEVGDQVSIQLASGYWRFMDFDGHRRPATWGYLFISMLLALTSYTNVTITRPWLKARGRTQPHTGS